jgi:hypothetical protein
MWDTAGFDELMRPLACPQTAQLATGIVLTVIRYLFANAPATCGRSYPSATAGNAAVGDYYPGSDRNFRDLYVHLVRLQSQPSKPLVRR